MRSTPAFEKFSPPFFPLSIPAPFILVRTIEYVDRHADTDAGQTLYDLVYSLAHEQQFNVNDLALLDEGGLLLAQALIHHLFQTGRLLPAELADAAEQIRKRRQARTLAAWRS